MGEAKTFIFEYEELIEALLKHQGIHDGIWALHLQFGMQVRNINVGSPEGKKVPGLVIPLLKIGVEKIEKAEAAGGISVDAAKVNPMPKP